MRRLRLPLPSRESLSKAANALASRFESYGLEIDGGGRLWLDGQPTSDNRVWTLIRHDLAGIIEPDHTRALFDFTLKHIREKTKGSEGRIAIVATLDVG